MSVEHGPAPESRDSKLARLDALAGKIREALDRDVAACKEPQVSEKFIETHARVFENALRELDYVLGEV